jgi:hypothetical protein
VDGDQILLEQALVLVVSLQEHALLDSEGRGKVAYKVLNPVKIDSTLTVNTTHL